MLGPDVKFDLEWVSIYTFQCRRMEKFRHGRVIFAGDSAHQVSPFGARGANSGGQDADNLAWKLAGVVNGTLGPEALDTYEQERKPHARKMIGLALMVGRAMTAGGQIGDLARRTIVPRMHLLPGLRERVIDSKTPALHRSALVHRSHLPGELAGTLCPNAVLPDGQWFDDETGHGFTVVVDRPLRPVERSLAESRGATVRIAEPGGELAQWLRRGRAHAAVVRPDYTVLCAGRDVQKVCAALPTAAPNAPR